MRIEIQLFATLAEYRPREGPGASDRRPDRDMVELPEGATVADLVRELGIPDTMPRMALVNGEDVEEDRRLASGDLVALFPPLAGG